MLNELLVADVRPGEVAVKVYMPRLLKLNPLNVATPFTALTVDDTPEGVEATVTAAFEPLTILPF